MPPQKPLGFEWKNKHSVFNFRNSLSDVRTRQQLFASTFALHWEPLAQKLVIKPSLRYVCFFDAQQADFTNIALQVSYRTRKVFYFIESDNLLNNRAFVQQNISPVLLSTSFQQVFERYVKLGFTVNIP